MFDATFAKAVDVNRRIVDVANEAGKTPNEKLSDRLALIVANGKPLGAYETEHRLSAAYDDSERFNAATVRRYGPMLRPGRCVMLAA